MAFADALQDTVTIYTTTFAAASGDTIGEQVKTQTPLYSGVKCKLIAVRSGVPPVLQREGSQQNYKQKWLIQMEAQYNGASIGHTAAIGAKNFVITDKQEIRGDSSAIHHMVYYLEEAE